MDNDIFSFEEQQELLKIMKGIFLYTLNNPQVLQNEKMFLRLLVTSCNNISLVIRDKNAKGDK